jgi:hypothetical protein
VRNGVWGWRHSITGEFTEVPYSLRREYERDGQRPPLTIFLDGCRRKVIAVVCTVAHLDGELTDHSDANLKFFCQQCHNRHDAKARARGRSYGAGRAMRDLFAPQPICFDPMEAY